MAEVSALNGSRSLREWVNACEVLVLEGELIDSDGTVFKAGDFVSFAPGTHHWSRTETGCVLAVFE